MKFSLADTTESNSIQRYDDTGVTLSIAPTSDNESISSQRFERSLFLSEHHLLTDFPISQLKALTAPDLRPLFELNKQLQLDVLLIGSGNQDVLLPNALMPLFIAQGMGVECMSLGAACRTYNILLNESRSVGGLLLI